MQACRKDTIGKGGRLRPGAGHQPVGGIGVVGGSGSERRFRGAAEAGDVAHAVPGVGVVQEGPGLDPGHLVPGVMGAGDRDRTQIHGLSRSEGQVCDVSGDGLPAGGDGGDSPDHVPLLCVLWGF